MKERPILFKGQLVRAILDGTKTQTRRLIKDVPAWADQSGVTDFTPEGHVSFRGYHPQHGPAEKFIRLPGAVGERLWVREAWMSGWIYGGKDPAIGYAADGKMLIGSTARPVRFVADGKYGIPNTGGDGQVPSGAKFRPSIHMPRWASRIDLEITEVRVQRLQDITEEDARAEGVECFPGPVDVVDCGNGHGYFEPAPPARCVFEELWDAINGARASWESNPWVWAISFKRIRP